MGDHTLEHMVKYLFNKRTDLKNFSHDLKAQRLPFLGMPNYSRLKSFLGYRTMFVCILLL
jgi:hypothetical protein